MRVLTGLLGLKLLVPTTEIMIDMKTNSPRRVMMETRARGVESKLYPPEPPCRFSNDLGLRSLVCCVTTVHFDRSSCLRDDGLGVDVRRTPRNRKPELMINCLKSNFSE